MSPKSPLKKTGKLTFTNIQLPPDVGVHKNYQSDVIIISEDKLENCFMKHKEILSSKTEWLIPFGIVLTLLATLVTCDFHDWGLSKEYWHAIFVIGLIVCLVWLIISLMKAYKYRTQGDVETLIEKIKESGKSNA